LKSWDEDVRVDYLWPEFGLIGEFDLDDSQGCALV
jgi:hypothetical protein